MELHGPAQFMRGDVVYHLNGKFYRVYTDFIDGSVLCKPLDGRLRKGMVTLRRKALTLVYRAAWLRRS